MKKIDEALLECYIELYKNSYPPADFQYLVDTAIINSDGRKVIDYNSYEISEKEFDNILETIMKKYKFKKYIKEQFRRTIYLGCSPKIVDETIMISRTKKINKLTN